LLKGLSRGRRAGRRLGLGLWFAGAGLAALGVGVFLWLRASLPPVDAAYRLDGFKAAVQIQYDALGVPRIVAQNQDDAFHALGFAAARDRLFQMDLLRRNAAGRLAELFGEAALEADDWHRRMGFSPVAAQVYARLPQDQKSLLLAYAQGVNQAMEKMPAYPFEFALLAYRPEPWRPEDSLLVVLGMFDTLTGWAKDDERMATVMEAALDAKVVRFFTPDSDRYTDALGAGKARRPPVPPPGPQLQSLLRENGGRQSAGLAQASRFLAGSNGWLVAPGKTWDGRAILANDMHLPLQVPNIWYRAEVHVGDSRLSGISLPGVPLFISGSNGHVAWGFTNTAGDFLDLVLLDAVPGDAESYQTPAGPRRFDRRAETIRVRGGADKTITVRGTAWGPVLAEPLLGHAAAVRWTLLDPDNTDLSLGRLAQARDAFEALDILGRAGGPPLNALLADSRGNIAWTYTGKIPVRVGLDGLAARSWADGRAGWTGYVPPASMPRIVNPPQGWLVNANQRMLGAESPVLVGQDFNNGYRAFRIGERLAQMQGVTEKDLLKLQLDAKTDFYRFYQTLALQALKEAEGEGWQALKRHLEAWDGYAEADSKGLAVLVEFRQRLADAALSPFMARCRALEPGFVYRWGTLDEPLRQLLEAQAPELMPAAEAYPDWKAFILAQLKAAADAVAGRCGGGLAELEWGCVNRVQIGHVFSQGIPALSPWLDMEAAALPGCADCVRVAEPGEGASERLVVAPGHEDNAIFHMPAGQSGHPLSPHYRDQQRHWLEGLASGLLAGKTESVVDISPP